MRNERNEKEEIKEGIFCRKKEEDVNGKTIKKTF